MLGFSGIFFVTFYLLIHLAFYQLIHLVSVTFLYWVFNIVLTISFSVLIIEGPPWPWSDGSWIYNYLCNQCLSPLMLWVRISIRVRCTTLCDKVCQWLVTGEWISPGPPVFSTNKTDCHDILKYCWKWR